MKNEVHYNNRRIDKKVDEIGGIVPDSFIQSSLEPLLNGNVICRDDLQLFLTLVL